LDVDVGLQKACGSTYPVFPTIITSMQYRRDYTLGATYFFTVVTFRRLPLLGSQEAVAFLREAIRSEKIRRPFEIDAMVILPDHLHAIWTLPPDDADYSIRWRNIKRSFTQQMAVEDRPVVRGSRCRKGEQAVWQRRFWEHRIRNECDFNHHINYIHYNPVKHGLVKRVADWPYSSIHRYIQRGILNADWGVGDTVNMPNNTEYE
jgi:putative transposase